MTETPTSPSVDGETREKFEKAWAERPWNVDHETGKDRAWRWWQAALTRPAPSSPALDPVTVEACAKVIERFYDVDFAGRSDAIDVGKLVCKQVAGAIRALIGQPAPSSTVRELDQGNASVASPSNGHPGSVEAFKWVDPECGVKGWQSLVWKGRYESAVNGRREFRQAYRETRSVEAPVAGELSEFIAQQKIDGLSRSINRMRIFVENNYPPILMVQELDWAEKQLAALRKS